jgi:hypothetical protein
MPEITNIHLIDPPVAPARQAEIVKDRRRPGRTHNVSRALVPLLRNPTAGLVAGDLAPVDSFSLSDRCLAYNERSRAVHSHLP